MKKIIIVCLLLLSFLEAATINTNKNNYTPNEAITVNFTAMTAKHKDWIGIYPAGSNNDWNKVIQWKWTDDTTNGHVTFNKLPIGNYDVRSFYNNSFTTVAHKTFSVGVAQGNAQITTSKNNYTTNETISVNFTGMTVKHKDWIGIYPAGSNNDWNNVVQWKWSGDTTNGHVTFNRLPAGNYDVRAFYNNSFTSVAHKTFSVGVAQGNPQVTTSKNPYASNEAITVNFTGLTAKNKDWVGIYPAGTSNAWGNVLQWKWTGDTTNGHVTFNALPIGNYDVRIFYNNSFTVATHKTFKVEANHQVAVLKTTKDVYQINDDVLVDFKNINGSTKDWLAIYPAGTSNAWGNVVKWKFNTGGVTHGRANFNKLPGGNYEARIFYNNSFKLEAKYAFKVEDTAPLTTLYANAEHGLEADWWKPEGNKPITVINQGAAGSAHSIRIPVDTTPNSNDGGGYLSFNHPPKKMKWLILDVRVGITSHRGNFSVRVRTKNGRKVIVFAVYLNHPGNDMSGHAIPAAPFTSHNGYLHNHPAPLDYYLVLRNEHSTRFTHFKINIEEKLKLLEPDNELLEIVSFGSGGGDFDNIKLSSH